MNKLLKMFDCFKVVVYVPKDHANTIIESLQNVSINRIGEYDNCMSWTDVHSSWTPTEKAKPFIGTSGQRSVEEEVRIEFSCRRDKLSEVVNYINSIHPYERAEIDIIPIIEQECLKD